MAAHQAPLSLGFSRQEHWDGLPFPSPMHECESEVAQSCPTLCYPVDGSPPGSPVPGTLQARTLEWVAISFSVRQYKINTQKSIDFTYTNNNQLDNRIEKEASFAIAIKAYKVPRIE